MRLRLVNVGIPQYKKIMRGRQWVGRVGPHADGGFFGKIGKDFVTAPTERQAFDQVCAKTWGFDSVEALQDHNREVGRRNRSARAHANRALDEMLRGNFKPLDELFRRK